VRAVALRSRYIVLAVSILAGVALLFIAGVFAFQAMSMATTTDGQIHAPIAQPLPNDLLRPVAPSNIKAVWANDGGDKIFQEETPSLQSGGQVGNAVWDGQRIKLFGARNEILSVALVLETGNKPARNVEVQFSALHDKLGNAFGTERMGKKAAAEMADIELFHVGYLQLRGLSKGLPWETYDERHIPAKCRRPHDANGEVQGGWKNRPCADRHVPDIAVPLALKSAFSIAPHHSQIIWADIYIPPNTPAGMFRGTVVIREAGKAVWEIPVTLQVRDFSLPDLPSARTMLAITTEDIAERYLGNAYPDPGTVTYRKLQKIIDRHYQLAHRHRISLVEGYTPVAQMDPYLLPRLDGSLFTPARGYRGPGEGIGNSVYAIGLYGFWPWKSEGQESMWEHADQWVEWFHRRGLAQNTEYFLYLIDESQDYPQLEQWAQWLAANPGPGKALKSMATLDLVQAVERVPSLSVVASSADIGLRETHEKAAGKLLRDPSKRLYLYNGKRPATGSFALEDDGTALRQVAWAQYKKQVDRWFYWNATYYNNTQCSEGEQARRETNVFQQARTFGCFSGRDPQLGETGFNYFNGDGLLFYPGTDRVFPKSSLGISRPIASLRLKHWRRGIQDVDYLHLAAAVAPRETARIVEQMVPKVLWEVGVSSRRDPTWVRADISWPTASDAWEKARLALADIIERGQQRGDETSVKQNPVRR